MDFHLGQIVLFAGSFAPKGFLECQGQIIADPGQTPDSSDNLVGLFTLLGKAFAPEGACDPTSLFLPKLTQLVVDGTPLKWLIATYGTYPGAGTLGLLGEVRPFAVPVDAGSPLSQAWLPCDGRTIALDTATAQLFALMGTQFGGDGKTGFALPKLAALLPASGRPLEYRICVNGQFPQLACDAVQPMPEPADHDFMVGSLIQHAYAPGVASRTCGFALCQGQLLPIKGFEQLYSIIGPNFGGNGIATFAMPKLAGPDGTTFAITHSGLYPARR